MKANRIFATLLGALVIISIVIGIAAYSLEYGDRINKRGSLSLEKDSTAETIAHHTAIGTGFMVFGIGLTVIAFAYGIYTADIS